MMGRNSGQIQMVILDMEALIPEKHLLRKINKLVSFEFIYELAKPFYSDKGRPSIDPVCLIKMLLVGYLYGIRSERRLEEEIALNIAYRWFCGFELVDKIPDHSVFSQNRRRRFTDDQIFRDIFNRIVIECIENNLVTGEKVVSDGSFFIPANVSLTSKVETTVLVEKSVVSYLDELDAELETTPGYTVPKTVTEERLQLKSRTDIDCGYIHQERKKGLGYLVQMTVDTEHGIITGVDCFPANRRESDIILKHVQRQMKETGVHIKNIALDAGYDVGAVHRGFELMGITDYCSIREIHNNAMKKGFTYDQSMDCFICESKKRLTFSKLIFKQGQGFYRIYRILRSECKRCPKLAHCAIDKGAVRINASPFYPAYYANRMRCTTHAYQEMKRLRSIWSEGTFAALKNGNMLTRHKKRGIHRATEECLLSALALNLKRIVKAV